MSGKREYGDYQTPEFFATQVCLYLKNDRGIHPSAILEPTCGVGSFIKSSLLVFEAKEYYGVELNTEYCAVCKERIQDERVRIINADFFSFPSKKLINDKSQILIIGNPPWATNSDLSKIGSHNLPQKSNFKEAKGFEAITGESNFDICEYMILQLIDEYKGTNAAIAMLCKTSVARNVFRELKRTGVGYSACDILEFDAFKIFGISAKACMLFVQLSANKHMSPDICNVYDFERPERVKFRLGYSNGRFYSDLDARTENFDGQCCFEWRQGIKHDCSKIMELSLHNGTLQNGEKEPVDIESNLVFPLIKSSMFKAPVIHNFSKYVIVTQRKAREETTQLEQKVPKTWEYLNAHKERFEKRKSSIYRGAPPFSMFGVGDYSYATYKVGVSGFYKHPLFSVLYSENRKPVMTDDTSYFICFESFDMAYVAMLLLNSEKVQEFLASIAFSDAKRPYTKKVLERLDFRKITETLQIQDLVKTERKLNLPPYITSFLYDTFRALPGMRASLP